MRLMHAALIALVLLMLWYGSARADWQVHQFDGVTWEPAVSPKGYRAMVNIEKSACELDLASLRNIKPAGTRLECKFVRDR
jgi:hypothetical protein